jgi:hypothetical protein
MRWLFRPSVLVALSAALVVGAAAVVFRGAPPPTRPAPLPVADGDREVAWLYPATNPASWERFVAACRRAADRLQDTHPGLAFDDGAAFPQRTTATPEVALAWPGGGPRLVFRWYKLTGDWKTGDWVEALLRRDPPPLAVVGGNNSDAARELAEHLHESAAALPEVRRPLLLLTQATADTVAARASAAEWEGGPRVPLTGIYPGRTFRFCFTNRQMADAVTEFVWGQDDLRPDSDPVYMVRWKDDAYSPDLIDGFWQALGQTVDRESRRDAADDWLWVTGSVAGGAPPPGLAGKLLPARRATRPGEGFRLTRLPEPQLVDSSVGTFLTPNRYEAKSANDLLESAQGLTQQRPLLIVTGQTAPSRRFLRALERTNSTFARKFVVVTGDALAFNTLYRDRQVAWPIQDLPFRLVSFCHYDPVDPAAGFRPHPDPADGEGDASATGTEDVLLYGDIVEALALALARDGAPAAVAGELADRVAHLRQLDGRLTFDVNGRLLFEPPDDRPPGDRPPGDRIPGNRKPATGEHVVCLRPQTDGDRVLPRATVEVWAWRADRRRGPRAWQRRGEPLTVAYDESPGEGGAAHE